MISSRKCMMIVSFFVLIAHQASRATSFSEVYTILSRYVQQPNQVGEIAPISQDAGRELIRFITQEPQAPAKQYLEVGGGCGAITVCIAKALRPQDHLDVIEIDREMCVFLRDRLKWYKNVTIHCCSILDWHPDVAYDGIISTLPFNSLGGQLTRQIVLHLKSVAKDGCMFSYVEYPIVRQFLQYFYGQERKSQFQEVQRILQGLRDMYLQEQAMVYLNVPPVMIYHLSLKNLKR